MDDANRAKIGTLTIELRETSDKTRKLQILNEIKATANTNLVLPQVAKLCSNLPRGVTESAPGDDTKYLTASCECLTWILSDLKSKKFEKYLKNIPEMKKMTNVELLSTDLEDYLRMPFILNRLRPKFKHLLQTGNQKIRRRVHSGLHAT